MSMGGMAPRSKAMDKAALSCLPGAVPLSIQQRERYAEARPEIIRRLAAAIDGERLSGGEQVAELEQRLAADYEAADCVAVASATSGLILSLRALDVKGPVGVPAFAFSATVLSVLWNRLSLCFLPVSQEHFNLDLEQLRIALAADRRVEAVLSVAVAGNPSGLTEVDAMCGDRGLPHIVDGAGALGAKPTGRPLGTLGDLVILSFSSSKLLPAGEGGAVLCRSAEVAARLRRLRRYGSDNGFLMHDLGLNARMPETAAALTLGALPHLGAVVEGRTRYAKRLSAVLASEHLGEAQACDAGARPSYAEFVVKVEPGRRHQLIARLLEAGIDAVPFYDPLVYEHPAVRRFGEIHIGGDLAGTRALVQTVIQLPIHSSYTDVEVNRILGVFRETLT